MTALYEELRPSDWCDVVGHKDVIGKIQRLAEHGLLGRVFWLVGTSGVGKTSIARLIAKEVADPYATFEINATQLDVATLRDFADKCVIRPLGEKGGWCFIVNEAHNLKAHIVEELQTVLEDEYVQRTSTWVFTTTLDGEQLLFEKRMSADAFLSRAIELELVRDVGLELEFAQYCRQVAQDNDLDGRDFTEYVGMVKRNRCNLRACLQHIEAGGML